MSQRGLLVSVFHLMGRSFDRISEKENNLDYSTMQRANQTVVALSGFRNQAHPTHLLDFALFVRVSSLPYVEISCIVSLFVQHHYLFRTFIEDSPSNAWIDISPSVAAILIPKHSVARRDVTFPDFPSFLLRLAECLKDVQSRFPEIRKPSQ